MQQSPIFISYSHRDEEWLQRLLENLAVLHQEGLVKAWSDKDLRPGDDWPQEIREALDRAEIAILLISTNFLASKFIMERELPALIDRKAAGSIRKLLPLIVTPCAWQLSRLLQGIEIRPKHRDSVASGTEVEQKRDLSDFTVELATLLNEPKNKGDSSSPATGVQTRIPSPLQPTSPHDESVYSILDIRLRHREWDRYNVELSLTHAERGSELPPPLTHLAVLDLPRLAGMNDIHQFAADLRALLFPDQVHRDLVSAARRSATNLGIPLRLRVTIGACARELHWLRWELLTLGSQDNSELSFENTYLIRYAGADPQNRRYIQQRPKGKLTAFLAAGLTDWYGSSVPPAEVSDRARGELQRISRILRTQQVEVLEIAGYMNPEALRASLRSRTPDILYLCIDLPGATESSRDADGSSERWPPRSENLPLAESLRGLEQLPRLVILSPMLRGAAPDTPSSALAWLPALREAYELSQAGVLGTFTTQEQLAPELWDKSLHAFFGNLDRYGRMDYALRATRSAIQSSGCHWAPVLVSCLRTTRIWYTPRFTAETTTEPTWKALLAKIKAGGCTPVLGPALNKTIAKARTEIALSLAEIHRYPMAFYERDNLPQVAQYVASEYKMGIFCTEYEQALRAFVLRRFGAFLDSRERQLPLVELLSKVAAVVLDRDGDEPHNILASLPFKLYVTANLNSFLIEALCRVPGKEPRDAVLGLADPSTEDLDGEPTPQHPLVYHLFGNLSDIPCSVITEDNYFDFLIHYWKHKDAVPKVVRSSLTSSSLLFLGFKLHHWDFRVLFRTLLAQEGRSLRKKHMHVAVQVDPDDDRLLDPERARSYLESYFSEFTDADLYVYWGSAEDFLRELKQRWDSMGG